MGAWMLIHGSHMLCGVGVGVEHCSLMQSVNVKGQVLLAGSSG